MDHAPSTRPSTQTRMSLHIGKAASQARESKPELKATCEKIHAF
jgi:hypothetical protein